jgi:hypothetical protein
MKRTAVFLSLLLVLALGAFSQTFDFTLMNKTGYTIDKVFVSPAGDDEWGEDVLGEDQLKNNKSFEIKFPADYEAILLAFDVDKYDMKCEYTDGSSDEWTGLKLEDITYITLTLDKKGNGVATWK